MKIGVVGGGPAGLYFALLMKKHAPDYDIQVVEQNPPGATYGYGIVFSERALAFLEAHDAESYADIDRHLERWNDHAVIHKGQRVTIDGYGFSGITRLVLLNLLQEHCQRHGVEIAYEDRLTDLTRFRHHDLIVGADGANSVVREMFSAQFQPSMRLLTNKYIWYGTPQLFDALALTFRETGDGVFVGHHYRFSKEMSTFIVECDAATWANVGFAFMTEDQCRAYCEKIFADELQGQPLLSNRSQWINYRSIVNRHWHFRNIVLLGDALRTMHFSIGSGTRMALEDAIYLYQACVAHAGDVPIALQTFEQSRRPGMERLLEIGTRSFTWYEGIHNKMHLDPLPFAYDYMMRSGTIEHAQLKERSPRFAAAYEAYMSARQHV